MQLLAFLPRLNNLNLIAENNECNYKIYTISSPTERPTLKKVRTRVFYLKKGLEEISKKVGEEAIEVILAANQQSDQRTIEEAGDVLYHLMVLLAARDIPLSAVMDELQKTPSAKRISAT